MSHTLPPATPRRVLATIACGMALLAAPCLRAADPTNDASATRRAVRASRADLAASYLRFEQTLAAYPPPAERVADVNRQFDAATLAFFSGKNAQAVKTINALAASLLPAPPSQAAQLAASLRVTIEPAVLVADSAEPVLAKIVTIYPRETTGSDAIPLALRLRLIDSGTAVDVPFEVPAGDEVDLSLELDLVDSLSPGTCRVELVTAAGEAFPQGQFAIVTTSLDALRDQQATRLAAIESTPTLAQALAACRARNALLSNAPSDTNTAQYLADPTALASAVADEIAALEAGRDPYYRRAGDYWRTFAMGKNELATRVFAPPATTGDQPVPLVIALHGAGGDENMFLEGYGAGLIRRLAEQHECLLCSPRTEGLAGKPENFTVLIDALAANYSIDRQRIYVLGHSMGGGAASMLAARQADQIRAVACLAGFAGFGKSVEKTPPVLAIGAELDPIIPAARIEQAAQRAIERGLPVTYRLQKDYGHTVMVGAVLAEVVTWLLEQK